MAEQSQICGSGNIFICLRRRLRLPKYFCFGAFLFEPSKALSWGPASRFGCFGPNCEWPNRARFAEVVIFSFVCVGVCACPSISVLERFCLSHRKPFRGARLPGLAVSGQTANGRTEPDL